MGDTFYGIPIRGNAIGKKLYFRRYLMIWGKCSYKKFTNYQDSLKKRNIHNFSFVNFPRFSPMIGKNLLKQIQQNKMKKLSREIY